MKDIFTTTTVTFRDNDADGGFTREFDCAKLPEVSRAHIWRYGLKRAHNDRIGGAKLTREDQERIVDETWAKFLNGDVPTEGAGAFVTTCRLVAGKKIKADEKARKLFAKCKDTDAKNEFLDAWVEAHKESVHPKVRAYLEAQRAAKAALVDEIDIGDES